MTVPEAYEFFFCDTIEEEEEDAEEAEAGEAAAQVQWPEVCEFFFRDSQTKRSGHRRGPSLASPPEAKPVPTPIPEDPMPISIPEAYDHFLGEDKVEGVLGPAALLQLQNSEAPTAAPQGGEPGLPAEPSLAAVEQLGLVRRQAGACRVGPRPALVSGTHCPGIPASRATGEGQAWTLVVSQCGGLGGDLGRKNQFLAIPGHGPDGAAQARSFEGLAVH